jgi:hypothetical protein
MNFSNLAGTFAQAKGALASGEKLAGILDAKIDSLLAEYAQALEFLKTLGMQVGKLRLEMGILPQVSTSIRGSINDLDPDKIQKMLEANPDKKLLAAILSALLMVIRIRDVVDLKSSKDVVLDVTLGVPPKISVDLQ